MSIPPPGYETPQALPPLPPPPAPQGAPLSHEDAEGQTGSRQADDNVQYEFKSVQALRGRAGSAKAKWQDQGWEFVSENRGTLRTELHFRRVKPKTFGAYLLSFVAAFGRLQPRTQLALVASSAMILAAGITGIVVGAQGGGDAPNPGVAQTTASPAPRAEPTITGPAVDEPLDDAEPSELEQEAEQAGNADHAEAGNTPRDDEGDAPADDSGAAYYSNCSEAKDAGVAPLHKGDDGYRIGLDRDRDGYACET